MDLKPELRIQLRNEHSIQQLFHVSTACALDYDATYPKKLCLSALVVSLISYSLSAKTLHFYKLNAMIKSSLIPY